MTKAAFDQISEGLREALSVAQGRSEPFRFHAASEIDVKAIRSKTGLSLTDFAARFGFDPELLRQWEQGEQEPLQSLQAYLLLIDDDPVHVLRVLDKARIDEAGRKVIAG